MRKRKNLSLKAPPRLFYLKMTEPYVVNALRELLDTIDGELKRGNYPRNVRLFESPFKHRSARQSVEVDNMFLNLYYSIPIITDFVHNIPLHMS